MVYLSVFFVRMSILIPTFPGTTSISPPGRNYNISVAVEKVAHFTGHVPFDVLPVVLRKVTARWAGSPWLRSQDQQMVGQDR